MMGEERASAHVHLTVLAEHLDDAAVATADAVVLGGARDVGALRELASQVDLVTFDHELVDLAVLRELENDGVVFRPSPAALTFAVDKAVQRTTFAAAGIAVPRFLVISDAKDPRLVAFVDQLDAPPVLKKARGGYDGRGVVFADDKEHVTALVAELSADGEVVVEERLDLVSEVAQILVRDVEGHSISYPLVDTLQRDGMCVETRYPSTLDDDLAAQADRLSARVAEVVRGTGVMAIEYFVTTKGLLVNEIALRPHNTGHWTIEGTSASQFLEHLLAVSGQALRQPSVVAPYAVMVNVVGASTPASLDDAQKLNDVFVHDYGKSWRPGRKLGHVTALGDEPTSPHVRAWSGARAYGTVTREA